MTDFQDFIPVAQETIDSVRARIDLDANAGVDPQSSDFIDTTEGGFFFDLTQTVALEIARLWDVATSEVPAVTFPAFAWGDYLDEHGEALGLSRKASTNASGLIRFSGTDGAFISTGTEVSTQSTGDDDDPVVFATTEDATIASGIADVTIEAEQAGAIGNAAVGTVVVQVSANTGISGVENLAAISGGSDPETDEAYRDRILLELGSAQGGGTVADYQTWALAYPGVGGVTVTAIWAGPGSVHVVIVDSDQNPVPDTIKYGLQDEIDPPGFLTESVGTVVLPQATITAVSTVGADTAGSFRLGTQTITYTGISGADFTGCTGGTGTFPTGTRLAQNFGHGAGLAPVGATVTVDTAASLTVNVVGVAAFSVGYSLDGDSGTVACRDALESEITSYINGLGPGDDVYLKHVESRFFRVAGVRDVSGVTLNAAPSNVAVAALEVPVVGTIVLT